MTSFIGLLPAIIAFRLAMNKSVGEAFMRVYIPTLLCLPDNYRVVTPGLPDPTFGQGVAVALLIAAFMRDGLKGYRFSHMDVVVGIYAFCVTNSEYQASGYSDAQNLGFEVLFAIVMPYLMA
ncbi:MAG: O-antigen ligase domain-containing protein, partial [Candidatus Methylumidiphilus sp.]